MQGVSDVLFQNITETQPPRPLNRGVEGGEARNPAAPVFGLAVLLDPRPLSGTTNHPLNLPQPPKDPTKQRKSRYLVESPVGAANLHRQLRHVGTAKAAGKRF